MSRKDKIVITALADQITRLEDDLETEVKYSQGMLSLVDNVRAELANRETEITALGELIRRQDHIISELEKRIDPQELIIMRTLMTGDGS